MNPPLSKGENFNFLDNFDPFPSYSVSFSNLSFYYPSPTTPEKDYFFPFSSPQKRVEEGE
ncbi:MAG: hypothetical protein C6I01_04170 [Epsilonproteobacteria bacterium]|nr:hypothetical protein [Campylobacterota bacterium]